MTFGVQLPREYQNRLPRASDVDFAPSTIHHLPIYHDRDAVQLVLREYLHDLFAFLAEFKSLVEFDAIEFFSGARWSMDPEHSAHSIFCQDIDHALLTESWSRTFDEPPMTVEVNCCWTCGGWSSPGKVLCDMAAVGKIDTAWPASLQSFVRRIHSISLPRYEMEYPRKATEVAPSTLPSTPPSVDLKMRFGMCPKKMHEVAKLTRFIVNFTDNETKDREERRREGDEELSNAREMEQQLDSNENVVQKEVPSEVDVQEDVPSEDGVQKWIIDLGAGQGYLSSMLYQNFGRNVLSVDSDEVQTCGAKCRAQKLEGRFGKDERAQWIHTTRWVGNEGLESLLKPLGLDQHPSRWTICGLHACGDLSANMIRLFANDRTIDSLVNCTCCFHSLSTTENFDENLDRESLGYPISRHLRDLEGSVPLLSKGMRMIACQSTWRWGRSQPVEEVKYMFRKHLFRTTLQVFLYRHGLISKEEPRKFFMRKLPARFFTSFPLYVRATLLRIGMEIREKGKEEDGSGNEVLLGDLKRCSVSDDGGVKIVEVESGELERLWERYETEGFHRLAAMWTLRSMMGMIIDSIILVDRFLFLMESGDDVDVTLIPLFDPVQSPRNFVLAAKRRRE